MKECEPAGIPIEVQSAIERCLERNPDLRFHSAHDLAFALKDISSASGEFTSAPSGVRPLAFRTLWIAAVVLGLIVLVFGWKLIGFRKKSLSELPLKKIQSLAVLPLKNLSGDPKQEYFADGMTEELIGKLGRIASLRVISRTSVMEYKKPLVDKTKTGSDSIYTQEQLQEIPGGRDPWFIIDQTPGVESDTYNIAGSESGNQSIFFARGGNFNNTVWNYDGINVNTVGREAPLRSTTLMHLRNGNLNRRE